MHPTASQVALVTLFGLLVGLPALAEEAQDIAPAQQFRAGKPDEALTMTLSMGHDPLQAATFNHETGTVKLWDLAAGKEIKHWTTDSEFAMSAMDLSPAGPTVAFAGQVAEGGEIDLYNTETDEFIGAIGIQDSVLALDFSPDGKSLAVASGVGAMVVVDLESGKPSSDPFSLVGKDSGDVAFMRVAFSPDGKSVAASATTVQQGEELVVTTFWRTIDVEKNEAGTMQALEMDYISDLDWRDDSGMLAVTTKKATPMMFRPDGEILGPAIGGDDVLVYGIANSRNGHWMAAAFTNQVSLYDTHPPGGMVAILNGYEAGVVDLGFTVDDARCVVLTDTGELFVWEMPAE